MAEVVEREEVSVMFRRAADNQSAAPTFERLSQRPDRDSARPGIEYYRRRDVIDLLEPVV